MGAGRFPAGHGRAGLDPVARSGPARVVKYQRAIQFLAQQRGFPTDAVGRYIDVHPIDQRVASKLTFEVGKLASNPETGHKLRQIPYTSAATVPAEVKDAVGLALADELSAGEIQILSIVIETPTQSSLAVEVAYVNLITKQEQKAIASVSR